MSGHFKFNRMEFSGSLGDLGTILPLAVGMILINKMNPTGVFLCFGLYYVFSGIYFKVTCPVEPMKIISAYAIASGITASQIQSSCMMVSIILLVLGGTGLISVIGKRIPLAVVRGVQLSTGTLLVIKGIQLMVGTSPFQQLHQAAEPYLTIQTIGPVPIGIIIGSILSFLTLFLLDNRRTPAAVSIVAIGLLIGYIFHVNTDGTPLEFGLFMPHLLPYGIPSAGDFSFALIVLVLPQIPMTIGNAVIANADLSAQYFPDTGKRVTHRALCLGMALANFFSFFLGGIPMCQGAGGLASRYRFGARTAGSNLIIGTIFILLVLFLGLNILQIIFYIPMAALGVLLVFAGLQLSLTLLDMRSRKEMFVVIVILGITLASNLAAGFIIGIIVALLLKFEKLQV